MATKGKNLPGAEKLGTEIAAARDDFLNAGWGSAGFGVLPNPDEVIQYVAPSLMKNVQKGHGLVADHYALYRHMRRTDPKLKSLIGDRKNALLSKPWEVVASSADPDVERGKLVAAFVEAALMQIGSTSGEQDDFVQDMRELLDAIPMGFAVSEVIWEQRNLAFQYGEESFSAIANIPAAIRQRRIGRFGFDVDGNLKYRPRSGAWGGIGRATV